MIRYIQDIDYFIVHVQTQIAVVGFRYLSDAKKYMRDYNWTYGVYKIYDIEGKEVKQ